MRQEFKPLLTAYIFIAGSFILITAIVSGLLQKDVGAVFQQIFTGVERGGVSMDAYSGVFSYNYLLVLCMSLVTYTVIQTCVAAYLSLYDQNGASPSVKQVWDATVSHLLPVFITGLLVLFMIMIGTILCVIPGIYLLFVLLPYPFVVVNERLSFFDAISRCFQLIKDNFWLSVGIYILAYLIVAVSASAIGIIAGLVGGLISYFSTKQFDTTFGVVTSILSIVQYLFYIVLFISIGLNYYNLVERREATGLSRRIDAFGTGDLTNTENREEEF